MTSRPDDTSPDGPIDVSSPACLMHEADPSYMGYFDAAELIARLNALLEGAHATARVALESAGEVEAGSVAERMRALHADDESFCALLKGHIARLGGRASDETGALYQEAMAIPALQERLECLARAQSRRVQTLSEMMPRVRDDRLRSDLARQLSTQSLVMNAQS